jgi:hypothetical protein
MRPTVILADALACRAPSLLVRNGLGNNTTQTRETMTVTGLC